ncbi:MAG: hypothetical protein JSS65_04600 [Armatimonadetes bacterium]|nr:hypothetical protein [Armatimonadota bacterium]
MDKSAVVDRFRNAIEWSASLVLVAAANNLAYAWVALQTAKGSHSQSVISYSVLFALCAGVSFLLTLLCSPGLVSDEKPGWAHVFALPLVYVVELKVLLLLATETKLNVRFYPEVALADRVANSPLTLATMFVFQAVILALWALSGRQKPQ